MKLNQAKKFYKKSQNDGLENINPFEIFKKINYELVRALQVVSEKIEKKEIDEVRQKNFTKALTIIYTLQTNLDFEKELKLLNIHSNLLEKRLDYLLKALEIARCNKVLSDGNFKSSNFNGKTLVKFRKKTD